MCLNPETEKFRVKYGLFSHECKGVTQTTEPQLLHKKQGDSMS